MAYGVADSNGYIAQYEVDIGSVPSPDVTLTTSDSAATISAALNNAAYTCVAFDAGDYTSKGTFTITRSGTSGSRRWIRLSGSGTSSAYSLSSGSQAKLFQLVIQCSYLTLYRITVDSLGGNVIGTEIKGSCVGIIADSCRFYNSGGSNRRALKIDSGGNSIYIQNSVVHKTPVALDEDNECIEVNSSTDVRIVNVESFDGNKGLSLKGVNPGLRIENCDFYIPQSLYTDGSGNYTPNNPDAAFAAAETPMSSKGGGSQSNPGIVRNNRLWGSRSTDDAFGLGSSEGYGFTISSDVPSPSLLTSYNQYINNLIMDCQQGAAVPRDNPHHNSVVGNIFYHIKQFNTGDLSDVLKIRAADYNEYYLNKIIDAEHWAVIETGAANTDVRGNMMIFCGDSRTNATVASEQIDYNAFYGTTSFTNQSPGSNISKSITTRANNTLYAVGDLTVMGTGFTVHGGIVTNGYLYRAMTAGTTGPSLPTLGLYLGGYHKDGEVVWRAVMCPAVIYRMLQTDPSHSNPLSTVTIPFAKQYIQNVDSNSFVPTGTETNAIGSRVGIGATDVQMPIAPFDKDIFGATSTGKDAGGVAFISFPTPSNIVVTPEGNKNTITFDSVEGAVAYNLYFGLSPDLTIITAVQAGNVITGITSGYEHTGLTDGVAYYYIVTARDANTESLRSGVISGVPSGGSGTPAYEFVSVGTASTGTGALTPGLPSGYVAENLLLMWTTTRDTNATLNATPTGWTLLGDPSGLAAYKGIALFGRIATGDSNDAVNYDIWSGSGIAIAQIEAFTGDIFTDLSTIKISQAASSSTSNTADIPSDARTISDANSLVLWAGGKNKNTSENGMTFTSPTGCDNQVSATVPTGTSHILVHGYTQQTTASDISSSNWVQSIAASRPYVSMVVVLKTQASVQVDPPQGTTVITAIEVDTDSAEVTFTYDDSDEDYFEYRLNSGAFTTVTSPFTISGLTENFSYNSPGVEVRAVNSGGTGVISDAVAFTTDAIPRVPDVIGIAEPLAAQAITDAGGVVSESYSYSSEVEINHVISQSPAPGTILTPGDTVSIVVSSGQGVFRAVTGIITGEGRDKYPPFSPVSYRIYFAGDISSPDLVLPDAVGVGALNGNSELELTFTVPGAAWTQIYDLRSRYIWSGDVVFV